MIRIPRPCHYSFVAFFCTALNEDVDMDGRVKATIGLMKTSSRHCPSVADMARAVGLSPWYFTRLFKSETSKSPTKYLQELRMQKAEEMFAKTLLSLKEVVYAVGLNDRSHFSREFKRLHGLTPKQFIAQRRKTNSATE
jgi:AraC-like DNA-binding protein